VIEPHVVEEDDDVVAVWKPPGMHTAPLESDEPGTLLAWVLTRFPEIGGVRGRKPTEHGLLHRLDRDTQGLVLFARNDRSFNALSAAFAAGAVRKRYSALCRRSAEPPPGLATLLPLPPGGAPWRLATRFRAFGPGRRLVAAVAPGSASSRRKVSVVYETLITALDERRDGIHVQVELTRGFRHQVRAHLASVGLPIDGDRLYLGTFGSAEYPLHLAAVGLSFPEPDTGLRRAIRIPDPWARLDE